jgi:sugar phosphate isomerase/epimerase
LESRSELRHRLGCRPGGACLEDGLEWAIRHDFHNLEFCADYGEDALPNWTNQRMSSVRRTCAKHGLRLTIHTLSAVNVAEFSPFLSDAVDRYLAANIDLAASLDASVIVHAGLHFSHQLELRREASLEHLRRAVAHAEQKGVKVLLENLNLEPDAAEVHYLGHSITEMRHCFDALRSANLEWAFVPNHAHLLPEGFDGFLDAFGTARMGMVLVADCRGTVEEHLPPGQGTLDFRRLFSRLDDLGFRGPVILTFGDREEKIAGRERILDLVT